MDHPLDSITPEAIENALSENKIQPIYEGEAVQLMIMNYFLGNQFSNEELTEMTENGKIKEDSSKYQEMYKIIKYAFPINFVNSNTVPTLCQ